MICRSHVSELEEKGWCCVSDSDLNLSIAKLEEEILDDISKMKIQTLPAIRVGRLGHYIDQLHNADLSDGSDLVGEIYSFFKSLPSILRFGTDPNLIRFLEKKLGIGAVSLGTLPIVRLDRPQDTRFDTPWHQDFWFSGISLNSVTVWIPLREFDDSLGYLLAERDPSHDRIVPARLHEGGSEPFEAVESPAEVEVLECRYTDLVFFRQSLLHRSGVNTSSHVRVSMQLRYNDMHKQQRLVNSFDVTHSEYTKRVYGKLLQSNPK